MDLCSIQFTSDMCRHIHISRASNLLISLTCKNRTVLTALRRFTAAGRPRSDYNPTFTFRFLPVNGRRAGTHIIFSSVQLRYRTSFPARYRRHKSPPSISEIHVTSRPSRSVKFVNRQAPVLAGAVCVWSPTVPSRFRSLKSTRLIPSSNESTIRPRTFR